ncbi:uncharacterized protein LOC144364027 [Saccoglossus kowalevskii]
MDAIPNLDEIQRAVLLHSSGKAPGLDSIPAEIYKEGGAALVEKLYQLFQLIWQHETMTQDFKDVSVIHLYKRKENCQVCNHPGISLLSIASNILARVLLNRLITHYVDLTFNTVSREGLWRMMAKYGSPRKFTAIVQQLHDTMLT